MKKLILLAAMLLVGVIAAGAQTTKVSDKVVSEGKTYKTVKGPKASNDIATDYLWYAEKDNITYPIYLHRYVKGENEGKWTAYVFRVSKKTGNEYKYYIPNGMAVAADILSREPNLLNKKN